MSHPPATMRDVLERIAAFAREHGLEPNCTHPSCYTDDGEYDGCMMTGDDET